MSPIISSSYQSYSNLLFYILCYICWVYIAFYLNARDAYRHEALGIAIPFGATNMFVLLTYLLTYAKVQDII